VRKGKKNTGKRLRTGAAPARSPVSPQRSATAEDAGPQASSRTRRKWIAAILVLATVVVAAVLWTRRGGSNSAPPPVSAAVAPARYVDGATCTSCHAKEGAAWKGSDHDLAMQIADEHSVLGNFGNAKFTYAGQRTR